MVKKDKLTPLKAPLAKDFLFELKRLSIIDFRKSKEREMLENKLNEFVHKHILVELKDVIEHPNQPGRKRHDVLDRIALLETKYIKNNNLQNDTSKHNNSGGSIKSTRRKS